MAQTTTLNFNVIGQSLERLDDNRIVEKAKNYVEAQFSFNEVWENTTKAILIEGSNLKYKAYLNEENKCLIPNRVVRHDGFTLTVVGEDSEKFITITTNDLFIPILSNRVEDSTPRYVEVIESDTLDVTRDGEKYNLEIPDTYVDETKLNDAIKLYRHTTRIEFEGHQNGTIWVDAILPYKEAFTNEFDLLEVLSKYKVSNSIKIYIDNTGDIYDMFVSFGFDGGGNNFNFDAYGRDEDNVPINQKFGSIDFGWSEMEAYTPIPL